MTIVSPEIEMAELIQAGIGRVVSDQVLAKMVAMQEQLQSRQQTLAGKLFMNEISRTEYVQQFDAILQEAARDGERALGFDDFHKVFGVFNIRHLFDVDAFINGVEP